MGLSYNIGLVHLLVFLLALSKNSTSVEFTFTSSCSGLSCTMLSTFRPALPSSRNLSLVFSPGTHRMSSSTMMLQRHEFLELKPRYPNNKTVIVCVPTSQQRRGLIAFNLAISYTAHVKISGLTFSDCSISFSRVNKTDIKNTEFEKGRGAIQFSNSLNVTIDKSSFSKYVLPNSNAVLRLSSTTGTKITRTNFTNNSVNRIGIIQSTNSFVYISCSYFYNNTSNRNQGIIRSQSNSLLFISNTIFDYNTVSYGGIVSLESSGSEALIISSDFTNNEMNYNRGAITINSGQSATIIDSKFIGHGNSVYSRSSSDVKIYCSVFVNTTIPLKYVHNNMGFCNKYKALESSECANTDCNYCLPPSMEISLEKSEYTIEEGIGKLNRALQVCAVTTDLLFGVKLKLKVKNGSAIENIDYSLHKPDCRDFVFVRKPGIQKQCTYVRILEDQVTEGTEQFSVSVSTVNPRVRFSIKKATVFIVEKSTTSTPIHISTIPPTHKSTHAILTDEPTAHLPTAQPTTSTSTEPTTSRPTRPTTFIPTEPNTPTLTDRAISTTPAVNSFIRGPSKTAIVECGPLRRYVNFTSECTDHKNLISAIAQSFGGLTRLQVHHIAVLQIKSKQEKYYFDIISPVAAIENNSMVKVVTYDGFSCVPKST